MCSSDLVHAGRYFSNTEKGIPSKGKEEPRYKNEEVEELDEDGNCVTKPQAKGIAKKEVDKHEKKMHKEEIEGLEEAVSRKDFRMVADLIKTHDSHDKRKELAQHHAEIFHRQNPRFDRKKFMAAANVQEELSFKDRLIERSMTSAEIGRAHV